MILAPHHVPAWDGVGGCVHLLCVGDRHLFLHVNGNVGVICQHGTYIGCILCGVECLVGMAGGSDVGVMGCTCS